MAEMNLKFAPPPMMTSEGGPLGTASRTCDGNVERNADVKVLGRPAVDGNASTCLSSPCVVPSRSRSRSRQSQRAPPQYLCRPEFRPTHQRYCPAQCRGSSSMAIDVDIRPFDERGRRRRPAGPEGRRRSVSRPSSRPAEPPQRRSVIARGARTKSWRCRTPA